MTEAASKEIRWGEFTGGPLRPLMGVVEVTRRCNMRCPICFSDSAGSGEDIPIEEIRNRMHRLLGVSGGPVPLHISGGEPTLREDLPDIIGMAREMGFGHIEVISNGIRLGQDPAYLFRLKERGLKSIYLQFDGLKKSTQLKLRGRDMTQTRLDAVDAVRKAGLCCTLAVAVARGINDGEIGDVVGFGIDNIDTVRAINFQSATRFNGRFELEPGRSGYSLAGLLALLEKQAGVPAASFLSDHIGGPGCNAASFVFIVKGRLKPLFHHVDRKDLDAFLGNNPREKIHGLFAGKQEFFLRHLQHPAGRRLLLKCAPIFGHNPINFLRSRHILLFAKSFMECGGMDFERIKRCAYGISSADGVYSFCAFNNLYRFDAKNSCGEMGVK